MGPENALKGLGLTDHEAGVYLALLRLGPSSVLKIAHEAVLKRPTTYLVLDSLAKQGLVSIVPQEKKKLFVALSPEFLKEKAERTAREISAIVPELLSEWKTTSPRPSVRFFDTKEGLLNVYREISESDKDGEVLTCFSFVAIPSEYEENYDLFAKLFEQRGVRGREIITGEASRHWYFGASKKFPHYEARIAPQGAGFPSDTIIYENKVALLSFRKRFALIIESEDIADSMRTLFELAWGSSDAFKK